MLDFNEKLAVSEKLPDAFMGKILIGCCADGLIIKIGRITIGYVVSGFPSAKDGVETTKQWYGYVNDFNRLRTDYYKDITHVIEPLIELCGFVAVKG